jgi:hypothetical protein
LIWVASAALLLLPLLPAKADPLAGGCQVFPPDNPWNTDISTAPIDPKSSTYIANINANGGQKVHPDFGSDPTYGIPYVTVLGSQPKVPVTFDYDDESDPGPYPIPPDAPIEGGAQADGDRHVLVIDTGECILYEMYDSHYLGGAQNAWHAGSGAVFDLNSNVLRPDGWTSADAAGLPIFPGLARCDEAMAGGIRHALRFTVNRTQSAHIYPARHDASSITSTSYPPMGLRFRLKASYDISDFGPQSKAIAVALQKYGMILADNGSNWFISGEADRNNCWDDDDLNSLKSIPGTAFEVVVSPPPADVTPTRNLSTTHTPTLAWTNITWANSYEVEISTSKNFRDAQKFTVSGAQSLTTPSLPNSVYYWHVRGINADGTPGTWGSTESIMVNVP